jgi:hypothetical protein
MALKNEMSLSRVRNRPEIWNGLFSLLLFVLEYKEI